MKEFYRYEAKVYGSYDEDSDRVSNQVKVDLHIYVVAEETPKCYWLVTKGYELWVKSDYEAYKKIRKRVRKSAQKKFAYETKEEALQDFIRRTKNKIIILERLADHANTALSIAVTMLERL